MNSMKKQLSLILSSALIVLVSLSGCGEQTKGSVSTGNKALQIVSAEQRFEYTVVISNNATIEERSVVKKLTDAIKNLYGTVKFINDAAEIQDDRKEIIIGNTKRDESKALKKKLIKNRANCAADYIICTDGDNVVINGGSDNATSEAVEYFIKNIIKAKKVSLAYDYEYSVTPDLKSMTIAGKDISNYSVVIPKSYSLYFDDEVKTLVETIRLHCGYELDVITENSENYPEHFIAIGTESTKDFLPNDDSKCRTLENKGNLYICAKENSVISSGVSAITKMIAEAKDGKLKIKSEYDNLTIAKDTGDSYKLVWSDEFNGNKLNTDTWAIDYRVMNAFNGGKMYYTSNQENILVNNGMLSLIGRWHENEKNSLTSGSIKTKNRMTYQYGYAEIRARLPKGNGIWPAFWALGDDDNGYQEIDFFEMFTNNSSAVVAAVHKWWFNLDSKGNPVRGHTSTNDTGRDYVLPNGETFNDDFHTFGCEWTPKEIRFFVDGNLYFSYDISGEGQDMHHAPIYLILCLQIGVDGMEKGVDETTPMPSVYAVDYVRLYQRPAISKLSIISQ